MIKEELGKWFLDIAKYITTVVILSTVFGEASLLWVFLGGVVAVALSLGAGIWCLSRSKNK